jgi:hypothetical protein
MPVVEDQLDPRRHESQIVVRITVSLRTASASRFGRSDLTIIALPEWAASRGGGWGFLNRTGDQGPSESLAGVAVAVFSCQLSRSAVEWTMPLVVVAASVNLSPESRVPIFPFPFPSYVSLFVLRSG